MKRTTKDLFEWSRDKILKKKSVELDLQLKQKTEAEAAKICKGSDRIVRSNMGTPLGSKYTALLYEKSCRSTRDVKKIGDAPRSTKGGIPAKKSVSRCANLTVPKPSPVKACARGGYAKENLHVMDPEVKKKLAAFIATKNEHPGKSSQDFDNGEARVLPNCIFFLNAYGSNQPQRSKTRMETERERVKKHNKQN